MAGRDRRAHLPPADPPSLPRRASPFDIGLEWRYVTSYICGGCWWWHQKSAPFTPKRKVSSQGGGNRFSLGRGGWSRVTRPAATSSGGRRALPWPRLPLCHFRKCRHEVRGWWRWRRVVATGLLPPGGHPGPCRKPRPPPCPVCLTDLSEVQTRRRGAVEGQMPKTPAGSRRPPGPFPIILPYGRFSVSGRVGC